MKFLRRYGSAWKLFFLQVTPAWKRTAKLADYHAAIDGNLLIVQSMLWLVVVLVAVRWGVEIVEMVTRP